MGPKTTFVAWLIGAVLIAALSAPREHGSGLFAVFVILLVGLIAGLIHALFIARRNNESLREGQTDDV